MLGRVCSTGRAEALAAVETLSRQLRKKRRKCKVQACPPFVWSGEAAADQYGLLTLPAVIVTKGKNRLSVTNPKRKRGP
jgi:hypothetical protein